MRTIQCKLDLVKSTEHKLRWDEDIAGTKFELYIPKWRVPDPIPPLISVKIYDATLIDLQAQPGPAKKIELLKGGLSADLIAEICSWLPIESTPTDRLERPITAIVEFYETKTQTVRYRPIGDSLTWELGEPYVPISELAFPFPTRLLVRVGWVY